MISQIMSYLKGNTVLAGIAAFFVYVFANSLGRIFNDWSNRREQNKVLKAATQVRDKNISSIKQIDKRAEDAKNTDSNDFLRGG